jgi:ubiquinone/menaquinone biosynthesis C-methylase UbiE
VALVVDPDGIEIEAIRELVDLRGRRVVEIGCGDGRITLQYARDAAAVLAFDTDEDAIRDANRGRPRDLDDRVRFDVADAAEIELPAGEFDLALFSWSL